MYTWKGMGPARLEDQDELRIGVTTAVAALVIGVAGIMKNANDEISAFDLRVSPTSDRVETVLQQNIGAGTLLHCQSYLVTGTLVERGCYVNARIVREAGAIDQPQFTLFSGYLDDGHQPSFPYGVHEPPLYGPGRIRSITGTNPIAGAESIETVPAGALWRLHSWTAAFVTDATAATREVSLVIDDGTTELLRLFTNATQTASLTRTYFGVERSIEPASQNARIWIALPSPLWLPAGYRIQTTTVAIVAGDNWGAPQYQVEEWLTP